MLPLLPPRAGNVARAQPRAARSGALRLQDHLARKTAAPTDNQL
jgi:hypothetical protein